jgi:hypothetical protein
MPDEKDQTGTNPDELPETPLHAHGSGIEDEDDRPRDDEHRGELLDDEQDEAAEATNTDGAASGGPPRENAGDDPSNVR